MIRFISRAALAWLALTVLQAVVGALLLPRTHATGAVGWLLMLVSTALTALVMTALAGRMTAGGRSRVMTLFAVGGGIQVNDLVEAVFFSLDIPRAILPLLFVESLVVTLAFAFVLDRLAGPAATGERAWPAGRGAGSWIGRVVSCDLLYVVTYVVAGMIVFPFVSHFYAGRPIPGFELLLPLQGARALVFVGLLLLMAARLAVPRATLALLAGVTLSLLGGVAPLLVPNPYLPDSVRLPHLVEVGTSNLLFGWLAARILTARRKEKAVAVPAAPSSAHVAS